MIPHMGMGIPHFHMGMCQSLFPYEDPRREMGIHFLRFPMYKWAFPISLWGCVNPCFHKEIPIWKRGAISYDSPYENRHSPFPYGDVLTPVSMWQSLYGNREQFFFILHMEMGIPHLHMGMC
jgi:hypothetical protein